MAQLLKPQHFITRENGAIIPVIAVDELPPNVNIHNVPRMLFPHETHGMTSLGTQTARHQKYVVNKEIRAFPPVEKVPNCSSFATLPQVFPPVSIPVSPPITPQSESGSNSPTSAPVNPVTTSKNTVSAPRNADPETFNIGRMQKAQGVQQTSQEEDIALGRKEYCSFWLRHGECDYAQQGCLYKHEMPMDKDTLHKLGLKDIPRWYREEYGLASLQAGNVNVGIEDRGRLRSDWRDRPVASIQNVEDLARDMQQLTFKHHPRIEPPLLRSITARPSNAWTLPNRNAPYASPFPAAPRGPPRPPSFRRQGRKVNSWDDPVDLLTTDNIKDLRRRNCKDFDLISLAETEASDTSYVTSPSSPISASLLSGPRSLFASKHANSLPSAMDSGASSRGLNVAGSIPTVLSKNVQDTSGNPIPSNVPSAAPKPRRHKARKLNKRETKGRTVMVSTTKGTAKEKAMVQLKETIKVPAKASGAPTLALAESPAALVEAATMQTPPSAASLYYSKCNASSE